MKPKIYTCDECEAEFKISFDMDDERYVVKNCPFCSAEICEDEDAFEVDDVD